MGKRCTSPCFSLFVVVALVTHLAELLFSALLAYTLYRDVTYRDVFFSLTAGLIILPLVLVQLVSAVFLLRRRGDAMTGGEAAMTGVLHVLQLGFLWRHVTLLRTPALLIPRNELWELFVLRLTFAFAGGFPLLLLQTYLLLTQAELTWLWTVYASLVASALSVAWSMASVQQGVQETAQGPDDGLTLTLLPWPASLFTWLWRAGEMVARTLCLALFAVLYHQWVLLVLGLHWLVMLLCLSLPQVASVSEAPSSASSAQRVAVCLMTSYSYVWCYVSFSKVRTAVWYTLYYVIMFLENCTLCIVWLIKTEEDSFTSKYLLVVITILAFLVAMACLLVFYKHFYLLPPRASSLSTDTLTTTSEAKEAHGGPGPCPACRRHHHHHHHHQHHQGNGKHSHPAHSHRPAYPPSEWSNQYRSALSAGQYYKHTMHDSLLDSASDRTSVAPHRCRQHHLHKARLEDEEAGQPGGERCTCACTCACAWRGEGDGVSVVSCQTSRSANSCPHRRGGGGGGGGGVTGMKASRSDLTDSTSVLTLASGASHNLG